MRTPHTTRLAFRLTPLVAAIACVFTQGASAAVTPYQVTNTGDAGTGTLRQAIVDANTDCNLGVNSSPVITFNIATGPFVIMPSTALPTFQCISGVYTPTVDGTTQSGWSANTDSVGFNAALPVVLDGSLMLAYGGGDGLAFSSFYGGVLTVRGLELMNFNTALYGNLFVTGNYLHNNAFGVRVDTATGSGTAIGGLLTEQHNLFWTNGTAISVSNVSNISVTENNFSTNSFGIDASTVSNLTVLANRFGYNQYAISGISVTGGSSRWAPAAGSVPRRLRT